MIEIWKNISDSRLYGYQVSNLGRVKALPKKVLYSDGRLRKYGEIIINPRLDGKKYLSVILHGKNFNIQVRVHQLVCREFISNIENKPCINHKDGNRSNNNITNLEWCTYKENTQDAIKRGTLNKPAKKVGKIDIDKIRETYSTIKISQKGLAKMFGLSQTQISRIVNYKNWK